MITHPATYLHHIHPRIYSTFFCRHDIICQRLESMDGWMNMRMQYRARDTMDWLTHTSVHRHPRRRTPYTVHLPRSFSRSGPRAKIRTRPTSSRRRKTTMRQGTPYDMTGKNEGRGLAANVRDGRDTSYEVEEKGKKKEIKQQNKNHRLGSARDPPTLCILVQ